MEFKKEKYQLTWETCNVSFSFTLNESDTNPQAQLCWSDVENFWIPNQFIVNDAPNFTYEHISTINTIKPTKVVKTFSATKTIKTLNGN